MNDNQRPWLIVLLPLALGLALAAGFLAGARFGTPRVVNTGFFSFHRDRPADKLGQVIGLIERNYVDSVREGEIPPSKPRSPRSWTRCCRTCSRSWTRTAITSARPS